MDGERTLPDYVSPPLIEVVCGVTFAPLPELKVPHYGIFWSLIRDEFPDVRHAPPLGPPLAPLPATFQLDQIQLPRMWFLSRTGDLIIQVQYDRILFNWRETRDAPEYPHYDRILEFFRKYYGIFETLVKREELGEIKPTAYELSYINHIPQGEGWDSLGDLASVFPDLGWQRQSERFLPVPSDFGWQVAFDLPDTKGNLQASVRKATRTFDNAQVLRFEMVAKGHEQASAEDVSWGWFDLAHEWIVKGFADLTSDAMQRKLWRRK